MCFANKRLIMRERISFNISNECTQFEYKVMRFASDVTSNDAKKVFVFYLPFTLWTVKKKNYQIRK